MLVWETEAAGADHTRIDDYTPTICVGVGQIDDSTYTTVINDHVIEIEAAADDVYRNIIENEYVPLQ